MVRTPMTLSQAVPAAKNNATPSLSKLVDDGRKGTDMYKH